MALVALPKGILPSVSLQLLHCHVPQSIECVVIVIFGLVGYLVGFVVSFPSVVSKFSNYVDRVLMYHNLYRFQLIDAWPYAVLTFGYWSDSEASPSDFLDTLRLCGVCDNLIASLKPALSRYVRVGQPCLVKYLLNPQFAILVEYIHKCGLVIRKTEIKPVGFPLVARWHLLTFLPVLVDGAFTPWPLP